MADAFDGGRLIDVCEAVSRRAVTLSISNQFGYPGFGHSPQGEQVSVLEENPTEGTWFELSKKGVSKYLVGASVADYCSNNGKARAFVFFSLSDNYVSQLTSYLVDRLDIDLIYFSEIELTEIGARNLIDLCYGEKPFFNEQIKRKMTRERFPHLKSAFILVYSMKDSCTDIRSLKADLRSQLSRVTFERRIHGTDDAQETRILVEAVTNPNTMSLLNRVLVSRRDRVFSRVPDLMRHNREICIDGSSVMELYKLRKSRDLDFICSELFLGEIIKNSYDVNNQHYKWLPFTSEQVIFNPYLHIRLYGLKFTSLSLRQLILEFKTNQEGEQLKSKKERDLRLIRQFNTREAQSPAGILGMVATLATQARLLFEFIVVRVMPKLPPSLALILRKIRRLF